MLHNVGKRVYQHRQPFWGPVVFAYCSASASPRLGRAGFGVITSTEQFAKNMCLYDTDYNTTGLPNNDATKSTSHFKGPNAHPRLVDALLLNEIDTIISNSKPSPGERCPTQARAQRRIAVARSGGCLSLLNRFCFPPPRASRVRGYHFHGSVGTNSTFTLQSLAL